MVDTIIAHHETTDLPGRGPVDLLHFHSGMVLMVSQEAVGLYRGAEFVADPLGNGLIGYEPIPETLRGELDERGGFVSSQSSGFVGLTSGAVLFIRPDGVALYPDSQCALNNREMRWIIGFEPLQ